MKSKLIVPVLSLFWGVQPVMAAWDYQASDGPAHWGKQAAICQQGKNQSPLDIKDILHSKMPALKFNYLGQIIALTDTGHGLKADIRGQNTMQIDGTTFKLVQFHFHTPAEHQIKGHRYPMEVHFVHADAQGNLAVVAQLFERGQAEPLLDQLLSVPVQKGKTQAYSQAFALNQWLPSTLTSYYRYNGSLTTPPCTEGVRWFIDPTPRHLTLGQLAKWQTLMGTNNRPVQPYYARRVVGK